MEIKLLRRTAGPRSHFYLSRTTYEEKASKSVALFPHFQFYFFQPSLRFILFLFALFRLFIIFRCPYNGEEKLRRPSFRKILELVDVSRRNAKRRVFRKFESVLVNLDLQGSTLAIPNVEDLQTPIPNQFSRKVLGIPAKTKKKPRAMEMERQKRILRYSLVALEL